MSHETSRSLENRGQFHRAARRAAQALVADGGTVLILSAKYGLLPLDRIIEPYELKAGAPGSVTAEHLAMQARHLGITDAEVIALTPKAYTQHLGGLVAAGDGSGEEPGCCRHRFIALVDELKHEIVNRRRQRDGFAPDRQL